jgi:aspartate racemase
MKIIGLIGGMSWKSTSEYYRIMNQAVKEKLGGSHSAKILLYSLDFHELAAFQHAGRWPEANQLIVDAAERLQKGGADFLLIGANTMHIAYENVKKEIRIPVLHVGDATAEVIKKSNMKRLGLLGTRFVMEKDFYKGYLHAEHGLEIIVPGETDRRIVHEVIFKELVHGIFSESSKKEYLRIIGSLAEQNAEGIILGCTELALLVNQSDCTIPLFDTTAIHARRAVKLALEE